MVPPVIKVGKLEDKWEIVKSSLCVVNSLHKKEQEINFKRHVLRWEGAICYVPDFSSLQFICS